MTKGKPKKSFRFPLFYGEVFCLILGIILGISAVLAVIDQIIKYFVLRDLAPV